MIFLLKKMPHESTVHRDTPYEHIGSDYGMMIKARSKSLLGNETDNALAASAVLNASNELKFNVSPLEPTTSNASSGSVSASALASSSVSTIKEELHHALSMPETPSQLTHHADFDDDDEDSDESKLSETSNTPPK